eukprot:TRINITY_DN9609_c0_g1_i2.p1 TRINITY_DN9609_c0_g1~~TRINITY_DN9609_c0_g1_i2.p1  ORF type:complete len:353 (-),score=95.78 TRINITY_DN9609_c0_g1_i2:122-1180(-)
MMLKSVKLQSVEGDIFPVDADIVNMCATVKNMLKGKTVFRNSLGGQFSINGSLVMLKKEGRILASFTKNSDDEAIVTLPDVKTATLQKVVEYCQVHNNPSISERDKKTWDSEFVQLKQSLLCELASASYYLDIKTLVNLTSRAIASQIAGKTSEEIQETFCNINYETYAPVFASSLAARCRLQRKFKKKQIAEKDQKLIAPSREDDNRSVDELLEFLGESTEKSKNKKRSKKKEKRKDEEIFENPPQLENSTLNLNSSSLSTSTPSMEDMDSLDSNSSKEDDDEVEVEDFNLNSGSSDEDDDLDPEMKAALDKEVEEFRQRLETMHSESRNLQKIPLPVSAASFVSSVVGVH